VTSESGIRADVRVRSQKSGPAFLTALAPDPYSLSRFKVTHCFGRTRGGREILGAFLSGETLRIFIVSAVEFINPLRDLSLFVWPSFSGGWSFHRRPASFQCRLFSVSLFDSAPLT